MAAGCITLLDMPLKTRMGGVLLALGLVGAAAVVVGAVSWFLPWHRWPERALLVPALGALGLIWAGNAFGDPDPYTYSIYFVVLFAWLGLNQPRGTALLAALPMAAAYLAPLFTSSLHDPEAWPTVFVAVPVCVLLSEMIAHTVARLRTSRELDTRRVGDLEAIVSAGALLQAETSPDQLGPLLARVATSVFHARESVVLLQDHADGRIVAGTHCGDKDGVVAFPALDAVEDALRDGQAVRRDDTLVVPLRGVSRILGAVALRFAPDTMVDTFAMHAAQLFGSQAGIALEQQRAIDELTEAAMQDPLTLVGNRRRASVLLEALQPSDAVVLIDLDQFKVVNDTAGHAAGDRVLVSLAQYLRGAARDADAIARYGGEEFLLVLRGAGNAATAAMQRLLEGWRALRPLTTFSAGVAVHQEGRSPAATLGRADAALYRAKNAGRDRVFEDAIGETV
jgi:diguanylate cyclase (GGDEF)-like protein